MSYSVYKFTKHFQEVCEVLYLLQNASSLFFYGSNVGFKLMAISHSSSNKGEAINLTQFTN